jgi:hypothetical protein
MDLRDWFAGQALKGLLAGPNVPKKSKAEAPAQYAARVAEEAYLFADAMLRVGEVPQAAPPSEEEDTVADARCVPTEAEQSA